MGVIDTQAKFCKRAIRSTLQPTSTVEQTTLVCAGRAGANGCQNDGSGAAAARPLAG